MRSEKPTKKQKKLQVNKQTVRELSKKDLEKAAGGLGNPRGVIQPTQTGNCYF